VECSATTSAIRLTPFRGGLPDDSHAPARSLIDMQKRECTPGPGKHLQVAPCCLYNARKLVGTPATIPTTFEVAMLQWFRNIFTAVATVLQAMWVSVRYWVRTYDPRRRTFTEQYEYPELPAAVFPRFRGYHRYDLSSCIACERCARDCPVGCIYIGKQKAVGRKGFQISSYTIDYTKCMFCAICVEACPVDCIFMGSSHDLSCYSRDGCIVDF
jgi:NADH-quinone oxidoreductase subunit I